MFNELEIRKQIQQQQTKLNDLSKHLRYINRLLEVSKWLTFGLYLAFAISIYLADIMHLRTFIESATGSTIGFGFYLVVCFMLAYVLAGIKHAAYSHMALFGRVVLIVAIVVSMGLMAEVFQSSGNQDMKARTIAENSAEFKSLVNTQNPATVTDSGLSVLIAQAQQKLARCEEKLKAGKEPHCKGDKSKLDSLLNSQQQQQQTQIDIATAKTEAAFQRMDKLKTDSYNPTIRALAETLGIALSSGIVLIMLFISMQFEALHFWLSEMKARTIAAIDDLNSKINRLEVEYFNATGAEYGSAGTAEKPAAPEPQPFGFGQPATAQTKPLFKYQQQNRQPFGFVQTDHLPKSTTPAPATPEPDTAKVNHPQLGSAETQLQITGLSAPETRTYNRELSGHGIHSPDDSALNRTADKSDIQRIINKGLNQGENRVHTVSEPEPEKPCIDRAHTVKKAVSADSLYPAWIAAINQKACKPSIRETRKWLQKRIAPMMTGSKTFDLKRIDQMAKAFFIRAVRDGRAEENPNYRNGGKKYLWIE